MLNPQNLAPGQEQYETFTSKVGRKARRLVQYDYRNDQGELFSTVKPSLEACRKARDEWADRKAKQ